MSFPRAFLQDLQDRLVLSDIIGSRVKVTRAGREFKACCPFHKEKTPSFTINNEKGFYHCFGCGAHGDAIKFVQEHDNLSFMETIELLAAQAGMQVPQQTPEDRQKAEEQKTLYDLIEAVTAFYEKTLSSHREAYSYLTNRGLSNETIKMFRLGYAPSDGRAVINHLSGLGYKIPQMIEAGIVRKSTKKPGEHYSFFRDRVMFPVADLRGRIVAFGGRILPSIAKQMMSEPPKYINSSDTPLFHKGSILYNLSNARPKTSKDDPFIVVEGYMDVIALAQAGIETAVAPLGTALTESQVDVLWRVAPPDCRVPVMCFDGDNAGRRAALRAMDRMLPHLKPDHSARFAFLPEGEDPDSLVQSQGRAGFESFVEASDALCDLLWVEELEQRPGKTPEDRAGLKASLLKRISVIEDQSVQEAYNRILLDRFYKHFNTKTAGKRPFKRSYQPQDRLAPVARKPQPVQAQSYTAAHYLLACIVNYPEVFDDLEDDLGRMDITDSDLNRFRQTLFDVFGEEEGLDSQELKDILDKLGYSAIIGALCDESLYLQAVFARPEQKLDDVREGLKFTLNRMRKRKKIG